MEIYFFQVSCQLSLPPLNIPNCQSVLNSCNSTANCLYLHDNYISKFDFFSYLFANLVIAWLYDTADGANIVSIGTLYALEISIFYPIQEIQLVIDVINPYEPIVLYVGHSG